MTTTTVEALIRKAALEANYLLYGPESDRPRTHSMIEASARLDAFSRVAADVLHICMAPSGFQTAILSAVRAVGRLDVPFVSSRETASAIREAWQDAVFHEVRTSLRCY